MVHEALDCSRNTTNALLGRAYAELRKLFGGKLPFDQDPSYYDDRASNGPVWVEHLSTALQSSLLDLAVSGGTCQKEYIIYLTVEYFKIATADNAQVKGFTFPGIGITSTSATDQVSMYFANLTDTARASLNKTLFTILIGTNDAAFMMKLSEENEAKGEEETFAPEVDAVAIVGTIAKMVTRLKDAGIYRKTLLTSWLR